MELPMSSSTASRILCKKGRLLPVVKSGNEKGIENFETEEISSDDNDDQDDESLPIIVSSLRRERRYWIKRKKEMGKMLSRSKKSKQKRRMSQSKKCPKRSRGAESESASGGGGGCMDLGKKRVAIFDENHVILSSPERLRYAAGAPVDLFKENNIDYESRLESLPMELLVKILCHMHHDQLKAVFHVSERIRTAVIVARRFHFNYTTPDRSRQEMLNTMTPLPTQHWPFVSKEDEKRKVMTLPRTPKAPRHGPRPPSRLKFVEMRQVAAVLFQESAFPPRYTVPSALPKPKCRSFPSNRVLFDEELELCQAVAQNKLR